MDNDKLTETFKVNHLELINYINARSDHEFMAAANLKWTPGQQLEHIFLCLKPMLRALSSKSFLMEKFGQLNRPVLSYETTIKNYTAALANGGKAPDPFLPPTVDLSSRASLVQNTLELVNGICACIDGYTEEELDSYVLPHPLLGNLCVREFMYMMSYHAIHHLNQTKINLG
jgi:hypothetical protein